MFEILINGDYNPEFWQDFGIEEDSPLVVLLLELSQTIRGWIPLNSFPRVK